MKSYLIAIITLFTSQLSWSADQIYCSGALKTANQILSIDLKPKNDFASNILVGGLPSDKGLILYSVHIRKDDYVFQIQQQDPPFLYLSETVKTLPAVRSKKIGQYKEVYIECKIISPIDYCRYNTCY